MARSAFDVIPLEGRETQIGLLLAMLDDGTADWRRELGAVTDEQVVWQPAPRAHSIGALFLHMADVEAFWLHEVAAGFGRSEDEERLLLSKETKQHSGIWPTPPAKPLAWYYAQQDLIRDRTRKLLAGMDEPAHPYRYKSRSFTLRWLLFHVITHESYHAGQAVLLSVMSSRLHPSST